MATINPNKNFIYDYGLENNELVIVNNMLKELGEFNMCIQNINFNAWKVLMPLARTAQRKLLEIERETKSGRIKSAKLLQNSVIVDMNNVQGPLLNMSRQAKELAAIAKKLAKQDNYAIVLGRAVEKELLRYQ